MKKISHKATTEKWFTYPEDDQVRLLIQPFSLFNLKTLPSEKDFTIQDTWEVFGYVLKDWEGIVGDDDKKLPVEENSKAMLFDFDQPLVTFVIETSAKMRDEVLSEKEVKNLSTSQPGDTQKKEKQVARSVNSQEK